MVVSNVSQKEYAKDLEDTFSGEIYKKIGLKDDPFTVQPKDPIKTFIGREKEFHQFIRSLRNLKDKLIPHLAILGTHGIGKTHFLLFLNNFLNSKKELIGFKEIILVKGEENFKNTFKIDELDQKNLINFEINSLYLIDDLDLISIRNPKAVIKIIEKYEGRIIGTWNPRVWDSCKKNDQFRIPKTEVLYLKDLSIEESISLVNLRLKEQEENKSKVNNFFPEFAIKKLAEISYGNPYRLITHCKRFLNFLLDNNLEKCDKECFSKFADELGIKFFEDLTKIINELTQKQKQALKFIIKKEEVSSKELADFFDFSREAAVQYLKALEKKELLDLKPKDKIMKYYVRPEIVDEIDIYLSKIMKEENQES